MREWTMHWQKDDAKIEMRRFDDIWSEQSATPGIQNPTTPDAASTANSLQKNDRDIVSMSVKSIFRCRGFEKLLDEQLAGHSDISEKVTMKVGVNGGTSDETSLIHDFRQSGNVAISLVQFNLILEFNF